MKAKVREVIQQLDARLPAAWKATALLQGYGLWKIPLLFSVRPKVREINEEKIVVEIPLTRWTKNHLGSMYFGALAIGADCSVGLLALHLVKRNGGQVHLSFKDFQVNFRKRAEGNVLFVCEEGAALTKFVAAVMKSGERKNITVKGYAHVVGYPGDPVAEYSLTLSLKRKE
jgi:acyl-coenzyme A thioesterase PaaI-like protein